MSSTRTPSPLELLSNDSPPPMYHIQDEDRYQRIRQKMISQIPTIQIIFGPGYTVELRDEIDDTSFYVKDSRRKTCLRFECSNTLNRKTILHVDNVNNCQGLKGEEVVAKVIQIARDDAFKADEIKLYDASVIFLDPKDASCHFSLFILKILSTGQSWYNQYGFFYDADTEDREMYDRNNMIRNMSLQKLFDDITYTHVELEENIDDLKNHDIFEMYKDKPVQELAKEIQNTFQSLQKQPEINCNVPNVKWYMHFLHIVEDSNVIRYNNFLIYKVTNQRTGKGGMRRQKTRKPKKNNKKTNKNKRTK